MSCLQVRLCGIPPELLAGLIRSIAVGAFDTVDHLDVFVAERFVLLRPPESDGQGSGLRRETPTAAEEAVLTAPATSIGPQPATSMTVNGGTSVSCAVEQSVSAEAMEKDPENGVHLYQREQTQTVVVKILPQYLTSFIKVVKTYGVGEAFGSIDVTDVRCTTQQLPRRAFYGDTSLLTWWQRCLYRVRKFNSTALDRLSTLEIHASVVANSYLSFNHVACIIIASGMAAIGLLTDSSVSILAAFFVSPLMQMILAVVWGLTVKDMPLARRGLRNMFVGAGICVFNGLLVGVIICLAFSKRTLRTGIEVRDGKDTFISINTEQIASRGPPVGNVVMSALIAAFSGIAIALGQGSGIASALTGVCISTSLLPPLVNAGMMWGVQLFYHDLKTRLGFSLVEVGAFSCYLYLANIVCIILFAWAAFKFKHVGGRTLRPMYRDVNIASAADNDVDPALLDTDVLCAFSPVPPVSSAPSRQHSADTETTGLARLLSGQFRQQRDRTDGQPSTQATASRQRSADFDLGRPTRLLGQCSQQRERASSQPSPHMSRANSRQNSGELDTHQGMRAPLGHCRPQGAVASCPVPSRTS